MKTTTFTFSSSVVDSVKQSYFNILSIFLGRPQVESRYVACLIKWAIQLNIKKDDLHLIENNFENISFSLPESSEQKIDALFDLVHMIYLDNIVEDIELEVASMYAEHLGYEKYIVGELFQSIATAPYDNRTVDQVKEEIKRLIEKR